MKNHDLQTIITFMEIMKILDVSWCVLMCLDVSWCVLGMFSSFFPVYTVYTFPTKPTHWLKRRFRVWDHLQFVELNAGRSPNNKRSHILYTVLYCSIIIFTIMIIAVITYYYFYLYIHIYIYCEWVAIGSQSNSSPKPCRATLFPRRMATRSPMEVTAESAKIAKGCPHPKDRASSLADMAQAMPLPPQRLWGPWASIASENEMVLTCSASWLDLAGYRIQEDMRNHLAMV